MTPTKTKRTDRQLSPDKAETILAGAMQEFLSHGYAATSMDRVASTAGVSKATVYSHFGDKEGLFRALVKQMAQKKISFLHGLQFQAQSCDVREALFKMLSTGLAQICQDQEHLAFIRLIIGESGRFPQLAQIFVQNLAKPGITLMSQVLASQPDLHIKDPEATARIVIGSMVHYVQIQEMLHGKEILPMERDRLIHALVDLIVAPSTE